MMVEELAPETPVNLVPRLITSFQEVSRCIRKDGKSLLLFVYYCLRHLALNYLNDSRSSTHSKVSSILALQLLVNIKLPSSIILAAKGGILHRAQSHRAPARMVSERIPVLLTKYPRNLEKHLILSLRLLRLPLLLPFLPFLVSMVISRPFNPLRTVFLPSPYLTPVLSSVSVPMFPW